MTPSSTKHILQKGAACSTCASTRPAVVARAALSLARADPPLLDLAGKARKVRCDAAQPSCTACRRSARFRGDDPLAVVCSYTATRRCGPAPGSSPEAAHVKESKARLAPAPSYVFASEAAPSELPTASPRGDERASTCDLLNHGKASFLRPRADLSLPTDPQTHRQRHGSPPHRPSLRCSLQRRRLA